MSRMVTVAAAQLGPFAGSKADVVRRMTALVEQAAGVGVALVTFPELALSPYFAETLIDDWQQWYEESAVSTLTQPLVDAARAAGITVVLPYAERQGGRFYNSLAVILPDGVTTGAYRKMHIPGFAAPQPGSTVGLEKFYFAEGDRGFPVFHTPTCAIGTLICYDRLFPEAYRTYQLGGAEVVCIGFASGSSHRSPDLVSMQSELVMRANAYQHGLWVVAAGKGGIEDGIPYIGGSCVISPDGEVIARARTIGDELVAATIDLTADRDAAMRMCANRRPEMYRLTPEAAAAD